MQGTVEARFDDGDIRLGRATCGRLDEAERREWWLSNGTGAYAAGTVAGSLTRRYHGLLVAPLTPPLGRRLLLAKADATLQVGQRVIPLTTNRWADGVVNPRGYIHLESFRLAGRMPVWRYAVGDLTVELRVWMEPGQPTVYLACRLEAGPGAPDPGARLRLALLANNRNHHHNTPVGAFEPGLRSHGEQFQVTYPEGHRLDVQASGGWLVPQQSWFEGFHLVSERARGLPPQDNHLFIGELELELTPGRWVGLSAGLEGAVDADLVSAMSRFQQRDSKLLADACQQEPVWAQAPTWIQQLVLASDAYTFARPLTEVADGTSVIAGYPWFGEWGRDTMIALPGLTLVTGRFDSAQRILRTFAQFVDRGMLPNVFPGDGEAAVYNTVDAALWYIEAWRAYWEVTGDSATLAATFPILASVIDHYKQGTRHGIRTDPTDGLLWAGESGLQVTWMDAKVGEWVVTPREGKAVEVNALWYNALMAMARLAEGVGRHPQPYLVMADKVRQGFQRFIKAPGPGLYDVLDGAEGPDGSVRPNQILAVSLVHSPLPKPAQAGVVAQCARELLTSYGLRSLSPNHDDYHGHYGGTPWQRDGAYHQGPAWAWLLGHYAVAEWRIGGDAAAARSRLAPFQDHLTDAGLGVISEIFDGDPPHEPCGAPSQAWSVACVLEAWWRLSRALTTGS